MRPFMRARRAAPWCALAATLLTPDLTRAEEGADTRPALDLCALRPTGDGSRSVRQRLVMFRPLDAGKVEEGETLVDPSGQKSPQRILASIGGAQHLTEVFVGAFPMPRFHTVVASAAPAAAWFDVERLPVATVAGALGGDPAGRFAAYALACADHVALPRVRSFEGTWTRREETRTRKVGKQTVKETVVRWALDADLETELVILRREGDTFVRLGRIEGSNGGLLGFAATLGAAGLASGGEGVAAAANLMASAFARQDHLSTTPGEGCKVPAAAVDGEAGLEGCEGPLSSIPRAAGVAGLSEAAGPACTEGDQLNDLEAIGRCELRKAAELVTSVMQRDARRLDGWRLYAPLLAVEGQPALALGRAEGVKRGAGFVAVRRGDDGRPVRVGFARVSRVGAGGQEGEKDPSRLGWRFGGGEPGTRMEEHAQLGLSLGVHPMAHLALGNFAPVGGAQPLGAVGADVAVGYDLSDALLDGLWLKVDLLVGVAPPAGGESLTMLTVQAGPEVRASLLPRVEGFLGLAASSTGALRSGGGTLGAGFTYGAAARAGLDLLLGPDWSLRLAGAWTQNFADVEYEDKDGNPVFVDRRENLSGAQAMVGLGHVF